jgi:glutamate-1-semialdehyde 2,1-aminomutase
MTGAFAIRYLIASRGIEPKERAFLLGTYIRDYPICSGPLYIKLGQILATRPDLLSPEIRSRLVTLQDDVPPMTERDLDAVLVRNYEPGPSNIFSTFSRTPIASASIAQVHEARLVTGERVAVKIVKKGVRVELRQNAAMIRFLLRCTHAAFKTIRHLDLPARFDEITALLLAQADMSEEKSNHAAMYASFHGHPFVRIPKIYLEYCTSDILVMAFVEGIRGKDAAQVEISSSLLARRIQDSIYTMLYHDGLCHADPHLGNLFFSKSGEIIFVDFGIVALLNEDEKWALSAYFYACVRKEWEIAVHRLTTCFVEHKEKLRACWHDYSAAMIIVLRRHYEERRTQWSTFGFFHDSSRVLARFGTRYTNTFTKIGLVFLSCEGSANQIDPDIDIWENARKFADRYSPYMSQSVRDGFDAYFGRTIPTSTALKKRASDTLVAPTHLDRYFVPSQYPLFISKAHGSHIEDADGNRYVDLSCGYGPYILGYAHPVVTRVLLECAASGWVNALGNLPEVELAEAIVQAFPAAERAIFANSGTEAVMQAIRICRAYRRCDVVAKFEGHYHGYSDIGMVSSYFRFSGPVEAPTPIHGSPGCHSGTVSETIVLQYGHPFAIDTIRKESSRLACVLCEPMPLAMGDYDLEFLRALRNVCTECGIPLVFDEVVSGFRVSYGGVQVLTGVEPDLTCLGKIIGGGLPCGAVIGREWLITYAKTTFDPFRDFESRVFVGGTMSGNSLSCATGLAVLRHLKSHPQNIR